MKKLYTTIFILTIALWACSGNDDKENYPNCKYILFIGENCQDYDDKIKYEISRQLFDSLFHAPDSTSCSFIKQKDINNNTFTGYTMGFGREGGCSPYEYRYE